MVELVDDELERGCEDVGRVGAEGRDVGDDGGHGLVAEFVVASEMAVVFG